MICKQCKANDFQLVEKGRQFYSWNNVQSIHQKKNIYFHMTMVEVAAAFTMLPQLFQDELCYK